MHADCGIISDCTSPDGRRALVYPRSGSHPGLASRLTRPVLELHDRGQLTALLAKLAEAKRRHDEVDATRRALEAEAAAITLEDLEEDDEGAEVWGEASEDDD